MFLSVVLLQAVENVIHIGQKNPINPGLIDLNYNCSCLPPKNNTLDVTWADFNKDECLVCESKLVLLSHLTFLYLF